LIGSFHGEKPEVTVEQSYGTCPEMTVALEAGLIDMGIVPGGSAHPGPTSTLWNSCPGATSLPGVPAHPLKRRNPAAGGGTRTPYP